MIIVVPGVNEGVLKRPSFVHERSRKDRTRVNAEGVESEGDNLSRGIYQNPLPNQT